MSSLGSTCYAAFAAASVTVLKFVNEEVMKPYMDEPFHVPQAQAYCNGDFGYWDPKITTPPGLYILSVILKRVFMLKCNLAMLRITPMLALLALPLVLTRLLCYHKRERPPPSWFTPIPEAVTLSLFPIAWFFGFLYYTEVPSLVFVVLTVVAATQNKHWLAALLGVVSCTFRQTNIIWVLYAYASSQLMYLRFRRGSAAGEGNGLHDPPALLANPSDLVFSVLSIPRILLDILPNFVPYAFVLLGFGIFIAWNGGIVLGDKSNHVPVLHVPQLYYFVGFATALGWPALVAGQGGVADLVRGVWFRMFGDKRKVAYTAVACLVMAFTVQKYTIDHPFLLADNRHYTFYVWKRVFKLHPVMPYMLIPGYIACAWAWFLRIGCDQSLLQSLLVPVFVVPTLLPTPLIEPRYFLVPYVLLRAQVADVPGWGVALEGVWYAAVNVATMWVFLYKDREGVGRFMW